MTFWFETSKVGSANQHVLVSKFNMGTGRWDEAFAQCLKFAAAQSIDVVVDMDVSLTQRVSVTDTVRIYGRPGGVIRWDPACLSSGLELKGTKSVLAHVTLAGPSQTGGNHVGLTLSTARCTIIDVDFNVWSSAGLLSYGNVISGAPNSNEHTIIGCRATLCGLASSGGYQSSYYFYGGDANASNIISCAATDSPKGFVDQSFLGNYFLGCSAENCPSGSFQRLQSVNTFAKGGVFRACYAESGSPMYVDAPTMIDGGVIGSGNLGTATIIDDSGSNPVWQAGATGGVYGQIGGRDSEAIAFGGGASPAPFKLKYGQHAPTPNWWGLNYNNLSDGDVLRLQNKQFWVPYEFQRGWPTAPLGMREAIAATIGGAATADGGPWYLGDRVTVQQPAARTPSSYRYDGASWNPDTWVIAAPGPSVRDVSAATDTLVQSDLGGLVTVSRASACALTLNTLAAGLVTGFSLYLTVQATNASGHITIVPGTSVTIDGSGSTFDPGAGRKRVVLYSSDGLAWYSGA